MQPRVQDPLLGKVLDNRFEMLDRIGEGGMGVVYRARQLSVDRIVAIKVLNDQVAQDPQWVGGFINEAKNITITFLAAKLVIDGQMTLGMLLAVQYILGQLNGPLSQLIGRFRGFSVFVRGRGYSTSTMTRCRLPRCWQRCRR